MQGEIGTSDSRLITIERYDVAHIARAHRDGSEKTFLFEHHRPVQHHRFGDVDTQDSRSRSAPCKVRTESTRIRDRAQALRGEAVCARCLRRPDTGVASDHGRRQRRDTKSGRPPSPRGASGSTPRSQRPMRTWGTRSALLSRDHRALRSPDGMSDSASRTIMPVMLRLRCGRAQPPLRTRRLARCAGSGWADPATAACASRSVKRDGRHGEIPTQAGWVGDGATGYCCCHIPLTAPAPDTYGRPSGFDSRAWRVCATVGTARAAPPLCRTPARYELARRPRRRRARRPGAAGSRRG